MNWRTPLTLLILCALPRTYPAQAASLLLTPAQDTSIFSTVPNNNLGRTQTLASGGTASRGPVRMLIRFEPGTNMPQGSIITNATLDVTVIMGPSPSAASTFALHRLLVNWGEGAGGNGVLFDTGRPAVNGEATWNNRFHPGTPWNAAGGRAGIDYVAAPSATTAVNTGTARFDSTPQMMEDIQRWVEDPESNFGWIVISESELVVRTARRFGAREHPATASRPTLRLSFTPFGIEDFGLQGNTVEFQFMGQRNALYRLETSSTLEQTNWSTLTNLAPLNVAGPVTLTAPADQPSAFFRIKRLPLIASQPQSLAVNAGATAQFSVSALPRADLTYQWQLNGQVLPGATNATLLVSGVDAEDLGAYTVVVTSGLDSIVSSPAQLELRIPPVIVQHPQPQSVVIGSTVVFSVTVTNNATLPVWYRWRKGTTTLTLQMLNERTATFALTNVQPSAAGNYSVVVSNSVSFSPGLQSTNAMLTVINP